MGLIKIIETQEVQPDTDRMVRFKKIKKFVSIKELEKSEVKNNGVDNDSGKHCRAYNT